MDYEFVREHTVAVWIAGSIILTLLIWLPGYLFHRKLKHRH